jgi:hypothetical protein
MSFRRLGAAFVDVARALLERAEFVLLERLSRARWLDCSWRAEEVCWCFTVLRVWLYERCHGDPPDSWAMLWSSLRRGTLARRARLRRSRVAR